jgi:hypothetical protein
MDHRCLYGHRVPASFTHAISGRACPTCGAATLTVVGYVAARKLAKEGGMEALAAFNAVRLLESEWALVPVDAPAEADAATSVPTAVVLADSPPGEDVDVVDGDAATPPRVRPVVRSRASGRSAPPELAPGDEAFFKES